MLVFFTLSASSVTIIHSSTTAIVVLVLSRHVDAPKIQTFPPGSLYHDIQRPVPILDDRFNCPLCVSERESMPTMVRDDESRLVLSLQELLLPAKVSSRQDE